MSAIAYFLESEGISTTGISLVRENTAALRPPRFLWVPFPLGRPLGVPNDAAFQHRVIAAALALFERTSGPVLEDYAEQAPHDDGIDWVCPVSFARPTAATDSPAARLHAEIAALAPWYAVSRARRGRSTFGVAGATVEQIAAHLLAAIDIPPRDMKELRTLGLTIEDLKAWYLEAATAQPGRRPAEALQRWLWDDTELGALLRTLARRCRESNSQLLQMWVRALLPRHAERDRGP